MFTIVYSVKRGGRQNAADDAQQAETRQTGIDWIPTGVIAVKLDLNMRRFGRNCDYVLTKRGDQVAQTAAWTGMSVSLRLVDALCT